MVKLESEDTDVERKLIHIRGGKRRKGRYAMLLDVALETIKRLDIYWEAVQTCDISRSC